jgi:hypothetical protein
MTFDLNWKPKIGPPASVDIPIIHIHCEADAQKQWHKAQRQWHRSQTAATPWDRYFEFITSGKVRLKIAGQAAYGFPEIYTARHLEDLGFEWWTTVQLFDYGKKKISDRRREKTEEVRAIWEKNLRGVPWPAEIQQSVDGPSPRNPDIVAYHAKRNEWRLCETKSWTDRINEGQLVGLAILHLLTKAPVAVVRIVPEGRSPKGGMAVRAELRYRAGVDVRWASR